MEKITMNQELVLTLPDGFRVKSEEEVKAMNMIGGGSAVCAEDPDRHVLISLGWKTVGALVALLLSSASVAKTSEAQIARSMKPYGYRRVGFGKRSIGGKEADNISFTYTAKATAMEGETCVLKKDRTLYFLHFYGWEENKAEDLPMWESIVASAEWK